MIHLLTTPISQGLSIVDLIAPFLTPQELYRLGITNSALRRKFPLCALQAICTIKTLQAIQNLPHHPYKTRVSHLKKGLLNYIIVVCQRAEIPLRSCASHPKSYCHECNDEKILHQNIRLIERNRPPPVYRLQTLLDSPTALEILKAHEEQRPPLFSQSTLQKVAHLTPNLLWQMLLFYTAFSVAPISSTVSALGAAAFRLYARFQKEGDIQGTDWFECIETSMISTMLERIHRSLDPAGNSCAKLYAWLYVDLVVRELPWIGSLISAAGTCIASTLSGAYCGLSLMDKAIWFFRSCET